MVIDGRCAIEMMKTERQKMRSERDKAVTEMETRRDVRVKEGDERIVSMEAHREITVEALAAANRVSPRLAPGPEPGLEEPTLPLALPAPAVTPAAPMPWAAAAARPQEEPVMLPM